MSLGGNIRYLRLQKQWSQDHLADVLGYKSYTTIQKWETGIAEPPFKTLERLADIFNVNMDELATADLESPTQLTTSKKGVKIPVIGQVAAGIPIDAIEDIIDYEEIPEDMASAGEYFGLRIKGDSMSPRICDGDIVIVKQQPDAESGDVVICTVNGDNATCKRLNKESGGILLSSINPAYKPRFFSNDEIEDIPVEIRGKVVEVRIKNI